MALRDKLADRETNGEKQWIHKRFHGDVSRADTNAVAASQPQYAAGAPLPPPPGA